MSGSFITFEGIEGSGKTTQIKLLNDWLKKSGFKTVLTREPGGTPIGDQVRAILLSPANNAMTPTTELLLYAAARAQHVSEVILPAIRSGKIVLSDRYADATTAYQGAARRLDSRHLAELHKIATGNLQPNLTFLLDISPEMGLKRARKRNDEERLTDIEDRFEREELDFHRRVRGGYLTIAKEEPARLKVIDALASSKEIHNEVLKHVKNLLG